MGGPRESTLRAIAEGKQCCSCKRLLPKVTGRETWCDTCAGSQPVHRVYMRFERMLGVWRVSLRGTGHLREFTFADDSKVEEMAERGNALRTLADKQAFEVGLRQGYGGVELRLTNAQLAAVRR